MTSNSRSTSTTTESPSKKTSETIARTVPSSPPSGLAKKKARAQPGKTSLVTKRSKKLPKEIMKLLPKNLLFRNQNRLQTPSQSSQFRSSPPSPQSRFERQKLRERPQKSQRRTTKEGRWLPGTQEGLLC